MKIPFMMSSPSVIQGLFSLLQVHGMVPAQDLSVATATERADISAVVVQFAIIVILCSGLAN